MHLGFIQNIPESACEVTLVIIQCFVAPISYINVHFATTILSPNSSYFYGVHFEEINVQPVLYMCGVQFLVFSVEYKVYRYR